MSIAFFKHTLKAMSGQRSWNTTEIIGRLTLISYPSKVRGKHPLNNYSTLSNLVHLARSRPAECPLPREHPYPDSLVQKQTGGIAASSRPFAASVATSLGSWEGRRGRSPS